MSPLESSVVQKAVSAMRLRSKADLMSIKASQSILAGLAEMVAGGTLRGECPTPVGSVGRDGRPHGWCSCGLALQGAKMESLRTSLRPAHAGNTCA